MSGTSRRALLTGSASLVAMAGGAACVSFRGATDASATECASGGAEHPFVETVARYFKGCNTADIDLMLSCFTSDVRAYFVDIPPVSGRENLATFWAEFHNATGARWTVDRGLAHANEAVVEWSMLWTPPEKSAEDMWRGTDWFIFENDLIREIRQYHPAHSLEPGQDVEFVGFSYAARGYPTKESLDSKLP